MNIRFLFTLLIITTIVRSQYDDDEDDDDMEQPTDQPPDNPEALKLPVDVGENQLDSISRGFGSFPPVFNRCGQSSGGYLNEKFKTANDIHVKCEPKPMRVIFDATGTIEQRITVGKNFNIPCMSILGCAHDKFVATNETNKDGQMVPVSQPASDKTNKICDDFNFNKSKSHAHSKVIFTNENHCHTDPFGVTMDGLHQNAVVFPRWLKKTESVYNLRATFFEDMKLSSNDAQYVNFITTPEIGSHVWKQCGATCDQGIAAKFYMPISTWTMMFFINGNCESIKICIDPGKFMNNSAMFECKKNLELTILPINGVIIWPNLGRASLMEIIPPDYTASKVVGFEFRYGVELNGKMRPEFYVGNIFREYVTSDSAGYTAEMASRIGVVFSSAECLRLGAGVASKNIQNSYVLVNPNAKVTNVDPQKAEGDGVTGGLEQEVVEEKGEGIPLTTTPAPPIASLNFASRGFKYNPDHTALYLAGKWWVWSLYVGFVVGTLVSVVGFGFVLRLLRKTVYGFWYRGMYKRYGCDASGTTGGITGVGFGSTTTGAMTIGTTATGTTTGTRTSSTSPLNEKSPHSNTATKTKTSEDTLAL